MSGRDVYIHGTEPSEQARLAVLSGRPRRANRLWRRAAVAGEALGARYELALIAQERASRGR